MSHSEDGRLADTAPLGAGIDHAAEMVAGMHRFLDRQRQSAADIRAVRTGIDVERLRGKLQRVLGVVDHRGPTRLEVVTPAGRPGPVATGHGYVVQTVRWNVFRNVTGAGLLCEPNEPARGNVIVLPDCDQTPEQAIGLDGSSSGIVETCAMLAEAGFRVLVPALISRDDTHSGIPGVRMTNQPHREFVYRAAFEVGRHIIGYEVQRTLAAMDAFALSYDPAPVSVLGHGEGAALALFVAALDTRVELAGVSGYFGPRESTWQEPIYRNVFGALEDFGDAEL
ncbi:MAG: dienelactone hydrolase family protein, partial [Candidatus Poribacteria bacterium]